MEKLGREIRRIVTPLWPPAMVMFAVSIATLGCSGLAAAASGDGDIVCSRTQQSFLLPKDCLAQRCGQGLKLGYCQLAPKSPGLARAAEVHGDKAGVLAQQYDNSVLRGPIRGPVMSGLALGTACRFVEKMFTPYKCKIDFAESISEGSSFYMQFECAIKKGSQNELKVNPEVFAFSPAELARTIGHEMVHADQCARHETYGNYEKAVAQYRLRTAFQELEAYSWEAGEDSFPRTFRVTATELSVITPDEQKELRDDLECADWSVLEDLATVIIRNQGGVNSELRDYLTKDPWIKSVWLPNNPNWEHQKPPGDKPKACGGLRMGA